VVALPDQTRRLRAPEPRPARHLPTNTASNLVVLRPLSQQLQHRLRSKAADCDSDAASCSPQAPIRVGDAAVPCKRGTSS